LPPVADDLLLREVALHAVAAVDAGDDGADAEGDQRDAGEDSGVLEELAHHFLLAAGCGVDAHAASAGAARNPQQSLDRRRSWTASWLRETRNV
jgi:hypothetical protein